MEYHFKTRGMGLIEAIVWVAVFVSAMLALMSTVLFFYRTSNYAIQQASATASAQRGIDTMIRSVREAAYASNGAYPVVSIAANDLVLYADVDSDAQIERVHYLLSGTTLVKALLDPAGDPPVYSGTEATSSISDNVRNVEQSTSLFTYYDAAGATISDYSKIGDVRYISATLMVDVDPNRSPTPISLRSSAAMRNLIGK